MRSFDIFETCFQFCRRLLHKSHIYHCCKCPYTTYIGMCVCVTVLHFELPHKLVLYVHNWTLELSSVIWRPCGKYKDNFVPTGIVVIPAYVCRAPRRQYRAQWSNTTYEYFYHMCKITERTLGVSFAKSHFLLLKKSEQSLTLLSLHHFVAETYYNFQRYTIREREILSWADTDIFL